MKETVEKTIGNIAKEAVDNTGEEKVRKNSREHSKGDSRGDSR